MKNYILIHACIRRICRRDSIPKKKKIVLWHLEAETFNTASNNIMLLLPRTVTRHIFHNMVVHANSFLEKELKNNSKYQVLEYKGREE